jgi:hypothetical protein
MAHIIQCVCFFVKIISFFIQCFYQEIPVADVCEAFKVARGTIQALQENAGRFASMVSAFCQRLGWHDLEGLVAKFQNRVSFGVRAEIAELTSIPFVKVCFCYHANKLITCSYDVNLMLIQNVI